MSFRPVLIQSGLAGWAFLRRTHDTQMAAFRKAPDRQSEARYFSQRIAEAATARDLVADRRLLSVALTAFGLEDDLNNRAFVQRILEDGTSSPDALANRLTDSRYKAFSRAFGFGPGIAAKTGDAVAMAEVVEAYWQRGFQAAIGEQDNDARIALYAHEALVEIAQSGTGRDTARWFAALGDPPLRQLFETAFGLPGAFAQIDLDQQLEVFREKARGLTGSDEFRQFAEEGARERLITRFLAMAQMRGASASLSAPATALALLRGQ